jgi:hypothetical protein
LHNNPKISGPLRSREDQTSEIHSYVDKLSISVLGIGKYEDWEYFEKNRRILIFLNSVFSFFLSRVSNFAVQKAGLGFSSGGGWNILWCSGLGLLDGFFLGRLQGAREKEALLLVFSELTL